MPNMPSLPPRDFVDTPPDAFDFMQNITNAAQGVFRSWGYRTVATPVMESYDIIAKGPATLPTKSLWKTVAPSGELLVVLPDATLSVVRLAASRLASEPTPLRLCYSQNVLRYRTTAGDAVESRQSGVELLSDASVEADAEAIEVAIDALRAAGLSEFMIEIGHVGYFKGLMEEAGVSGDKSERLRVLVEEKNELAIELALRHESASAAERIMKLATLFGDASILDEALRLTSSETSHNAATHVKKLVDMLTRDGFGEYISIDLGMVHEINYYTGIVFRGITSSIGRSVLRGGRYDDLPKFMGMDTGAVGFAITTQPLIDALIKQGVSPGVDSRRVLVGYAAGCRAKAMTEAARLRAEGYAVSMRYGAQDSVCERFGDEYAKGHYDKIIYINDDCEAME